MSRTEPEASFSLEVPAPGPMPLCLEAGGMTWERTHEDYKRHATQKQRILVYLQGGHPLTQDLARELFGCMRLASRISELRRQGHLILSVRNRQGVASYIWLAGRG